MEIIFWRCAQSNGDGSVFITADAYEEFGADLCINQEWESRAVKEAKAVRKHSLAEVLLTREILERSHIYG